MSYNQYPHPLTAPPITMGLTKGNPVRVSLAFHSAFFFSKSERAWMIWRWANVQKMGDRKKRKSKKNRDWLKDIFNAFKNPIEANKWQVHSWLDMYSSGFACSGSLSLLTVPAKTCQRLRDLANCKREAKSTVFTSSIGPSVDTCSAEHMAGVTFTFQSSTGTKN